MPLHPAQEAALLSPGATLVSRTGCSDMGQGSQGLDAGQEMNAGCRDNDTERGLCRTLPLITFLKAKGGLVD